MQNVPPKFHKHVLKLQGICHFGPFDPDATRVGVLWLVMVSAGQSDGATAMCHHFTRSCLHNDCSSVILCGKEGDQEKR